MKADLSRVTFDPTKRFSSVVYQQGRVVLDADLNEEHEIESYTAETEGTDVIGPSGAPKEPAPEGLPDLGHRGWVEPADVARPHLRQRCPLRADARGGADQRR